MAFCIKEKQFVDAGYTAVENKFFVNFMPDAPDIRSAGVSSETRVSFVSSAIVILLV